MNRREFLRNAAALTATELILGCSSSASAFLTRRPGRVVVVGAGMGGLSAADQLLRAGYSVQLLEAGPRIGGRVQPGMIGSVPFDIGGQAFSKEMLRIQALGRRFGLTTIPRPPQVEFFMRNGRLVTGAELDRNHQGIDDLVKISIAMYPHLDNPAMRQRYGNMSVMEWARQHLAPTSADIFRSRFNAEWCDSPDRVSLLHYLEASRAYIGDDSNEMDFRFREGMFRITEGLARELGPALHLNSPVLKIDVVGKIARVTAVNQSWEADAVILAVPVPVLRNIPITGVDLGSLPAVVQNFSGAAVRKIVLTYARPFWKGGPTLGEYTTPDGLSMQDNSDMQGGVYSIAAFLGGPEAYRGISTPDLLNRLASVLGKEALSPLAMHDQPWLGERFIPGGYAANRVKSPQGWEKLQTEFGRVCLAGTDTATEYPTYIEGALMSAERAVAHVQRVITADRQGLTA